MIKSATTITVKNTRPGQIYEWLVNLTPEKYRKWHPAHIDWQSPGGLKTGQTIWFSENIKGHEIKFKWKVMELKEGEYVVLKVKVFYPIYLYLRFNPSNGNAEVTHELRAGFRFLGLGKIFDWFMLKFAATPERIKDLEEHAREEFEGLEQILSSEGQKVI